MPYKRKLYREHVKETKTNKNQTRPKQKKKLKPKQPVKTTKKSFFKKDSNLTKERACPVRKENRIENQVNLIFLKYAQYDGMKIVVLMKFVFYVNDLAKII